VKDLIGARSCEGGNDSHLIHIEFNERYQKRKLRGFEVALDRYMEETSASVWKEVIPQIQLS
jgi:hypothetical protein